jgi:hypothetical protein
MNTHRRRITRLEAQHIYQLAAATGREFGVSAEEILIEAREFFRRPPEAQRKALFAVSAVEPERFPLSWVEDYCRRWL